MEKSVAEREVSKNRSSHFYIRLESMYDTNLNGKSGRLPLWNLPYHFTHVGGILLLNISNLAPAVGIEPTTNWLTVPIDFIG